MEIIYCNFFSIAGVHDRHPSSVSQHLISSLTHVVSFTTLGHFNQTSASKTEPFLRAAFSLQLHFYLLSQILVPAAGLEPANLLGDRF